MIANAKDKYSFTLLIYIRFPASEIHHPLIAAAVHHNFSIVYMRYCMQYVGLSVLPS